MHHKIAAILLIIGLLFGLIPVKNVHGSDFTISSQFGSEKRSGFTQYQIRFLFLQEDELEVIGNSRLKFPFDSYFSGGDIIASYAGFSASLGYWKEYRSNNEEIMEDFDWLTTNQGEYINLAYGTTTPNADLYYYYFNLEYDFRAGQQRLHFFHIRRAFDVRQHHPLQAEFNHR